MQSLYPHEELSCDWNTLNRLIRNNYGLIIIIFISGDYAYIGQNQLIGGYISSMDRKCQCDIHSLRDKV